MALLQLLLLFELKKYMVIASSSYIPSPTHEALSIFFSSPHHAIFSVSYALGKLKTSAGRSRECGCWALTIAVLSPPGTGGHQEVGTSPAT